MKQFMFVVVLYEKSMLESPTLRSLSEQSALMRDRGMRVVIVDNTPDIRPVVLSIDSITEYIAIGKNLGLANAYQLAFQKAKADDYQFLVLLDQDSQADSNFIVALDAIAHEPFVGIWCPDIISDGKRISPFSFNALGWPNYSPPVECPIYGINSFSAVNVKFIDEIGGFEQFYWLDCLDLWLYEKAHQRTWTIERLNVTVEHDLSLVSGKISLARMKNIAFYESCFLVEFGPFGRASGMILRLALRGLKQWRAVRGVRNYVSYLQEIGRGIRVGLQRRKNGAV